MIKDITKIRGGINRVIVKLHDYNDTIKLKNGTELYLETKYTPAEHTQVVGIVQALPMRLNFDINNHSASMEWDTDMELNVGDTVYMEYFAVMMALANEYDRASSYDDPTWFEHGGSLYICISYGDIYFKVCPSGTSQSTELIPINGYLICRSINVKPKSSFIIEAKKSRRWVQVTHVGKANKGFLDKHHTDVGTINVGDIVLFKSYANQRIENSLHNTLGFEDDSGKGDFGDYVVIQRRWCLATFPDKMLEHVVSGNLK